MKIKIIAATVIAVSLVAIVKLQGSTQETCSGKSVTRGHVVPLGDFGPGTRATYNRIIQENDKVIFKFSRHGCPPCKSIAPIYQEQAQSHKDILFVEINTDMYGDLAASLGIQGVPTFIMYKDHQEYARWTGGNSQQLRSHIARISA